ncbi:hypothetical protein Mgra_00002655 [Meloidogyne graminicola]|uniref:Uncharacterized protein n=1 Tax=Meloidogyne graminicola TaxID=189291 RepID=A0A8S9ZYF7_9BILA|nr:hypothetical protein Mgra_00002655 [Meloidogyne graminicola]
MSRDLYPSNSNIIDLRSKILPTQAPLKTKQFINELDRLSSTPLGQKERNLSSGITYENERWFSPRFNADMNISLPPRRSIFTPSRLSSRRIRESTKPYWRCPQPVSTSSTSNWYNTTIASMGKSSDNSSSVGNAATSINKSLSLDKPVSVCNVLSMDNMGVITSVNNTVTTFTDNAPSVGYITPVEDKGIDNAIDQEDEIAIVSTAADVQPAFTFADSIIRNPKCPTPPKPKPIYHDKEVQTDVVQTVNGSLQNSIANNIVDKMPVVAKLFEEPPPNKIYLIQLLLLLCRLFR